MPVNLQTELITDFCGENDPSISSDYRLEKFRSEPGGINKMRQLVELYSNNIIEKDLLLKRLHELCVKGRVWNVDYPTTFHEHILKEDRDVLVVWIDDCADVLLTLCGGYPCLKKLISKAINNNGVFVLNTKKNVIDYNFVLLIEAMGFVDVSFEPESENVSCVLRNNSAYNGMRLFEKVVERNPIITKKNQYNKMNKKLPNGMSKVSQQIGLINIHKEDSENKTTKGDGSPIASVIDKLEIYKNISFAETIKKDPLLWEIIKSVIIAFIIMILGLLLYVSYSYLRGRSPLESLDSKADISPTISKPKLTPTFGVSFGR